MSDLNYPDILGAITGGDRCNIDAVQVAVATRPRVARVGRPFEVILLVQNASDSDVDVTMVLHLPPTDANKQKDRFITKSQRILVGIKPAEVGYVMLPANTLADTAIGEYSFGVEIAVKTLQRGARVRANEGGGAFSEEHLTDSAREQFAALKELQYHTTKRRMGNIIDVPLSLMSGGLSKVADFSPGWFSLSRLSDYGDPRPFLRQYGERIQVETLPSLKRAVMLKPLQDTTKKRWQAAGFQLMDIEVLAIAKLLTLILEYATPRQNAHGHMAARGYNIQALIERDPLQIDAVPELPHWFRHFMIYAESEDQVFSHPAQLILGYLYEDLVADAIDYSFALIMEMTGVDLGTADEMVAYREKVITAIRSKRGMDFSLTYLPLLMGGIIISEQLPLEGEHPSDVVNKIKKVVEDRIFDSRDDERPVFDLERKILAQVGQKHGFRPVM